MWTHVRVYVCPRIYADIYACVRECMYRSAYLPTDIHTYTLTYIHIFIRIYTYIYIYVCVCVCVCVCVYVYVLI